MTPILTPTTPGGSSLGPVVVAFAALPGNGCLACNDFLCNCGGLPTATPEIDPQGRRIFRRNTGAAFRLVVEAQTGTSGAAPGSQEPPLCTSGQRPDLQIQSNRDLGNMLPGACPPPAGATPGVQGFPTPDFGPSQQVTVALQDFGARFDPTHTSATEACTLDQNGFANFLSAPPQPTPGPTGVRQYCLDVDLGTQFPGGDTVLTVQVRDTSAARNLGPTAQIIVRIPTPHP